MFTDGRVFKNFRIENANSLISFEKWIRDNTDLYLDDTAISKAHLKIFIDYMKRQIKTVRMINKKEFLEQLDILMSRLDKK
jgi:hypothetical protein